MADEPSTSEATESTEPVDATTSDETVSEATTETPTIEDLQAALADRDKTIGKLRSENAKTRVNAKQKAADDARATVVDDIAKALGLKDDEAPTVETLQETIAGLTAERDQAFTDRDQAALKLVVYQTAKDAGADPELLLDSQSFTASLADVDPTNIEELTTAMKTWVEENPKYAATQAASRSSIEHTSGPSNTMTLDNFRAMDLRDRAAFATANRSEYLALMEKL